MNYQAPSFQPLWFLPASQEERALNSTVLFMCAVANLRLPTGGNHWCFYLDVGNGHSVRLDMTPSYSVPSVVSPGGSKGNLLVSYVDYPWTHTTTKTVRLDTRHGAKVRDFVQLLIDHKRHQYEFNAQGQGCRYWVDHQLTLFQTSSLVVNAAQVTEARHAILVQYPDYAEYPLIQSDYYP